jgi:hypothetical protein
MRHSLCLRMAPLICLSAFVIALWGCAAHPPQAGHAGRRTIADLFQSPASSTPPASPEPSTNQDWQLWTTIKARWPEVERLLADRHALRSTPQEPPRPAQSTTYVFDSRHIALIEAYARAHGMEPKDVIYAMYEEFFHHHGDLKGRSQPP